VGFGSARLCERRSADRYEGDDERVDAERDEPRAHREDGFRRVAEAGDNVRAHLPAAEDAHGRRERVEIICDRNFCLTRHRARAYRRLDGFEMHAERSDAGRS